MFLILVSSLIGFQLHVQVGYHFPAALKAETTVLLLPASCEAWSCSIPGPSQRAGPIASWEAWFVFGDLALILRNFEWVCVHCCSLCATGYLSLFIWDTVSLYSLGWLWTYPSCPHLPAMGLQACTTILKYHREFKLLLSQTFFSCLGILRGSFICESTVLLIYGCVTNHPQTYCIQTINFCHHMSF